MSYGKLLLLLIFLTTITISCKSKERINKTMKDTTITHKYTNHLINEKSPYLLQHAHNPVNWYAWHKEAFDKAKKEDKPVFLSIGYSTCHWCHVMEHESFEDEEVAKLLNDSFISIKVDREERPDIDNIYMTVCQMMTGSGGWPLTIIMTPDKKPFFAGTYFPKESRGGRIGLKDLVAKINSAWKNQRGEIYKSADEITSYLSKSNSASAENFTNEKIIDEAFAKFSKSFDTQYGGFGKSRKFPSPHNLIFLLRYYYKTGNTNALNMVTKTLTEMRKGGIYDQVGFGFHRYSTVRNWFLPHFEKMLYDQAMLVLAYTEAYQATKNNLFKRTAEEVLEYVLRDMTSEGGGFYSAEDADSEGEEGKFYVWDKKEVFDILGKEDGELFTSIYNFSNKGTYHDEATGKATGKNIPFLTQTFDELSHDLKIPKQELEQKLNRMRIKLFNKREKRIHPYKDDKILTDWNGLMIASLAKAGKVFDEKRFINAAEKSVNFIYANLFNKNGELLHRFRDNEAAINGQIDDYSFLIWGLLELYEATFNVDYLIKAIKLTDILTNKFWDKENNSGFYFTAGDSEKLISRPKEFYDGAIPSGNSVMFLNLQKLSKLTADIRFDKYADNVNKAYSKLSEQSPTAFAQFLSGLIFYFGPSYEVVIVGDKTHLQTKEMLEHLYENYIPNKVVLFVDVSQNNTKLFSIIPFLKDYVTANGKSTAYVCKNHVCNLPTSDSKKMLELLRKK